MKLIVGLGNPGKVYSETRHNIGSFIIKSLAKELGADLKKGIFSSSLSAKIKIGAEEVILATPLVFMNLSGSPVAALVKKYRIVLNQLLVVFDDLDLELGRIKLKAGGSSAGHKGLESIIGALGDRQFLRLRVGIGRPKDANADISRYVLSPFLKKEKKTVQEVVECSCTAIKTWISQGTTQTMNLFNR